MLSHIIFNPDKLNIPPGIRETEKSDNIVFNSDPYYDDRLPDVDETERFEWKESFWVTFSDAQIALGYVSFQKYINRVERVLEFRIYNHHLLPEFNIIRHWFAKKLGTKRFYVHAVIMLEGHTVTDIKATSTQIDQIGPGLIDSIKYQRMHGLTREPNVQIPDKSLFTADEMFGMLDDDDEQGNIFNQSEEEILAMLLEKANIRNKKHLAYLAGSKQSQGVKLKYTLHPHFGFLFFVEGEQCHHFIWELLNSHATYIWSIDRSNQSLDLQWQRIERTINTIRSAGRDAYKRSYQEQHTDKDLIFHFIPHEDIDSKFVDGFPRWRERLNEQLV